VRILLWHVHGSWTTAFVQGAHDYLVPVTPDRGPDGLGRARTWEWPESVVEVPPERLAEADVDLVVLQRPHEAALCAQWLGRVPGRDLPAVYLEHNTPVGDVPDVRHPMADQVQVPVVHVTGFNELMWDNGRAPTHVIEHGIVDPGHRYTGDVARAAVVVNEPVRRGRSVGTDLVRELAREHPVDVFGMQVSPLATGDGAIRSYEDLPQHHLHAELPRRRVYVHTARWTSLGLSLLEAMHLGMPVVAVAATEAAAAVVPGTGVLATRPEDLSSAVAAFLAEPDHARQVGQAARAHVLARYGLERFLAEWDALLTSLVPVSVTSAGV
jgi:glycosyltransferase involved in cell wall biosynthesis